MIRNIDLTLVTGYILSRENTQPENMCNSVYKKAKRRGGKVK